MGPNPESTISKHHHRHNSRQLRYGTLFNKNHLEPTTEEFRSHHLELLQELNMDVSTEAFLSAERAFIYSDLYVMLGNEHAVVWLTPNAAVMPADGKWMYSLRHLDGSCRFCKHW
jgi:hypothetical protein